MLIPGGEVASGLLCGALFGIVLENSGFGSPVKLTGQFRLTDWSVFKVMFTGIVVASLGLHVLSMLGLLDADGLFVPPAVIVAAAIGGGLVGAGFAVGGYCPGTSVVACVSGRVDAVLFLLGLLAGTWLFAAGFEALLPLTEAGQVNGADTLPELLHVPALVLDAAMIAMAVGVFQLAKVFERKGPGPVTAAQAVAGDPPALSH